MVKLRIGRLLRERGLSVYRLVKLTRLPPTTAYRLARGQVKRLDLRLVDTLCRALHCSPGDLFEYRR